MDTYSSGEDLLIKTRKPYTITKQRERWTEDEHSRFLEALKLYGRAWQRIEEHIGTKTAVQIRSHAQKFFSKLEKEALVKGASLGQALDIGIPPPRPKRKPSNPYPRKSSAPSSLPVWAKDGKPLISNSSLDSGKETLELENTPPPEQPAGSKYPERGTESPDEHNCSEVLNLFQEAPCASISSASKSSITEPAAVPANPCTLKEFVPSTKERTIRTTMEKSYLTVEPKECQKMDRTDANNTDLDSDINETQNSENHFQNSFGIQGNQNYPRHVPVHIVDGSSETYTKIAHENPNLFKNPIQPSTTEDNSNMSSSSIHHPLPSFIPPFSPLSNIQENYQSYLNLSSTFSRLIVSSLLQNPAAHAAACLAASFSPSANTEFSVDSPAFIPGGFPPGHNPSPSMPTIAAVTVAAASAWWAAHGLFPLCTPFHPGLACTHVPVALNPSANASQTPVVNKESKNNSQDITWEDQKKDPEFSETPKTQHSASKSPPQSSSDSEESEGTRLNGIELNSVDKPVVATGLHESNKPKTRKQVDRSSCGSNTSSSSEIETTNLEKNGKGNEESKEPDVNQSDGDINNRRIRSAGNINEFWKEVSEEGKLAFQALFSREVLPQSFSPPHDLRNTENGTEECMKLQLDLNSKTWEICPNNPEEHKDELWRRDNNSDKGLLVIELGHGKLKTRRTGFKPYKRCSVEAKESNRISNGSGQGEEKGPKRIRLEGETSMC